MGLRRYVRSKLAATYWGVRGELNRHVGRIESKIARTPWGFRRVRTKHYSLYQPLAETESSAAILSELREHGIVTIPDFVSQTARDQLLASVGHRLEAFKLTGESPTGYGFHNPNIGGYRILKFRGIDADCDRQFFDSELNRQVTNAYVCRNAKAFLTVAELREPSPGLASEMIAHFDDWKHRFKAFVYLTDVGPNNGPLIYYRGSHREAAWRRSAEYDYASKEKRGRYGLVLPHELEFMSREHGYQEQICTAPAGTLILFDARGLHRASLMTEGRRVLLGSYYAIFADRKWKAQFG